jgi:hypothetical protein
LLRRRLSKEERSWWGRDSDGGEILMRRRYGKRRELDEKEVKREKRLDEKEERTWWAWGWERGDNLVGGGWVGGENLVKRFKKRKKKLSWRRLSGRRDFNEEEVGQEEITCWWEGWDGGDNMMTRRLRRRR